MNTPKLNLKTEKERIKEFKKLLTDFEKGVAWANTHFKEMTSKMEKRFEEKLEIPLDKVWEELSLESKAEFLQINYERN